MTDGLFFSADHAVTLRWMKPCGTEVSRASRLRRVSDSALSIVLPRALEPDDALTIGRKVSAEAGDFGGNCLAMFRGSVRSIESRIIEIRLDQGIDVIQRRRFPRAKLAFRFNSAVLLSGEQPVYFLAHPIDLSAGGVRIVHRLPLQVGNRFRLILRLGRQVTVAPICEVIGSNTQEAKGRLSRGPTTYVTRATFVELPSGYQDILGRYVDWLIRQAG